MTHTPAPPGTYIDSDAALLTNWEKLMGHDGFGRRSLWLIFLDGAGCTLPVVVPIDDVPVRPDEAHAANIFRMVTVLAQDEPGMSVAVLLSRPGSATMTPADRAWGACLVRLARTHGVTMWPVHLATADRVQVMAADELIGL